MRRLASIVSLALPVAFASVGAARGDDATAPPTTPATSSPSAAASTSSSTEPPRKGRKVVTEPTEVELIDLTGEVDPDPQRYAVGVEAGASLLYTHGSGAPVGAGAFAATFAFGLGPGGARVPWSIEAFAGFSVTRAALDSAVRTFPDRFTEIGARLVYRGDHGLLEQRWLAVGAGLVWSSYGTCSTGSALDPSTGNVTCIDAHSISPGALLDLGVGMQEWTSRSARYGIAVRAPFELSAHWGFAAMATFYAQLGLGR